MPFISFCCLTADARTSNTILNNGESGHPCCVPDLRGESSQVFPIKVILAVGFSYMAFMMLRYVPSILTF